MNRLMMRNRSIRYYFFTSITTVLVASVLVMGLIQTWLSTNYFRSEKDKQLRQVVDVVAGSVHAGNLFPAGEDADTLSYMAEVTRTVLFITDTGGNVEIVTGGNIQPQGAKVPDELLAALVESGSFSGVGRLGGLFPTNYYISGVPLIDSSNRLTGFIFAATDTSTLQVYIIDTMSTFVLSAAIVLFVSSVLALVLTNRTINPIRQLSNAAKRFAEGDYSARVPVEGDDELATLSVTFNEMANSVEATDISRRSFMGNIAHELRTPMTTIKGFIDGMIDGTIPVEQRDKYLAVVSDEVGRLARLTKNMLDISRLEAGEYQPDNTVFDIWDPITAVMIGAEKRIEDKIISIEGMEHEDAAMVLADADFVHQVLYNLVDNAIKFADDGGTIGITVGTVKGQVNICIKNSGSAIEAEALAHVFDRFYKADKSRGVNARGAELGLHISKVLVGLMGGRIWAESDPAGWSTFTFSLPAATVKKPLRGKWS